MMARRPRGDRRCAATGFAAGGERTMDGRRFDDLTRVLGGGTSRRRVLAGLAGAALGLVGRGRARADISIGGIDWTGRYCGGFAAIPCPGGYVCVDDAGDDCDPAAGGADCAGVCVPSGPEDDPCAAVRCAAGFTCCAECGGTCEPIQPTVGCEAILCIEGTRCCEICGRGTCVAADTPCPLAFCAGEPCSQVTCGPGEFCCNYSCSTCVPFGGACTEEFCGGEPCGNVLCPAGEVCCNASCGICTPPDGACIQIACLD